MRLLQTLEVGPILVSSFSNSLPVLHRDFVPIPGLSRPSPQYPNSGSPWHPGCIERCFCPDLAKLDSDSLLRLCKYTNAGGNNPTGYGKLPSTNRRSREPRSNNIYSNPGSSSESSMESCSGTDVICMPRGVKGGRASPLRAGRQSSRMGRLGTCGRYSNKFQLPRGMVHNHRTSSSSPNKYRSGEIGWFPPPPQILRPTIQVSLFLISCSLFLKIHREIHGN